MLEKAATLEQIQNDLPTGTKPPRGFKFRGLQFYVRETTPLEWDTWEAKKFEQKGRKTVMNLDHGGFSVRFAIMVLCDENGKKMCNSGHADLLLSKGKEFLDKVWNEGHIQNGENPEGGGQLESDDGETEAEKN